MAASIYINIKAAQVSYGVEISRDLFVVGDRKNLTDAKVGSVIKAVALYWSHRDLYHSALSQFNVSGQEAQGALERIYRFQNGEDFSRSKETLPFCLNAPLPDFEDHQKIYNGNHDLVLVVERALNCFKSKETLRATCEEMKLKAGYAYIA